ncbi:MAG TPA: flagellar assembly protein FliW, partial [Candidatus Atribacteria bacterium]|nr:flagellar assembly protein FliW [Candidatus Atribacteria bacterium]
MILTTKRFGKIEIDEANIINFPKGILGFPHVKRYTFISEEENDVFLWLQGIDDDVAFIVTNPLFFKPDYSIKISPEEIEELQTDNIEDIHI